MTTIMRAKLATQKFKANNQQILSVIWMVGLLSACTNGGFFGTAKSTSSSIKKVTSSATTLTIIDVVVAQGQTTSSSASASPIATVSFSANKNANSIGTYCGGGKSCVCQFSWDEINSTSGSNVTLPRLVQTPVSAVQSASLTCPAPSVYFTEILDSTLVKYSVLPVGGNGTSFTTNVFKKSKGSTGSSTGTISFSDSEGHAFDNVLRYSCYEQVKRGMSIRNKVFTYQDSQTGAIASIPYASQFCLSKFNGSSTGTSSECPGLGQADFSAQANYFNLFIRDNDKGSINIDNAGYKCPQVREAAKATGDYWPLDSNFAVALSPSSEFPVGIEAYTKISSLGDPNTAPSSCFGGAASGTQDDKSLVRSCLGFAAKPKANGSCPAFTKSDGSPLRTYRLRRYVALYPPIYDTDGKMIDSRPQSVDTVYVIDRPVMGPGETVATASYTMKGPKPCPSAYLDHTGLLTNGRPSYRGTNDAGWAGKNVDGIQFPNFDYAAGANRSCSAAMPIVSSDKRLMTVATLNTLNAEPKLKQAFIRPIQPWAPHYEEDTDFQACAPLSEPFVDPPLHLIKDPNSGNVAWCAEAYPTQNPNVQDVDTRSDGVAYSGQVRPFTSHVVKNVPNANACNASTTLLSFPANYPANGKAKHLDTDLVDAKNGIGASKTCDRTTINSKSVWMRFPLLAEPHEVESALLNDPSYQCSVTYDQSGSKSSASLSPSGGCCGTGANYLTQDGTHLESGCQVPNY